MSDADASPSLLTDPARYTRPAGPAVLVAGATGTLGGHLVRELVALGHRVVALTRDPSRLRAVPRLVDVVQGNLENADSLARACEGVEVVFSCAGASLDPGALRDRRSYDDVDWKGNTRLLQAAYRAGVERFLYVSLFGAGELERTEYAGAHARFEGALATARLRHTVIRPTGFFASFLPMLGLARRGRVPVIGDGRARTNPIHQSDLAELCATAVAGDDEVVEAGGPEVLTRREIAELALAAVAHERVSEREGRVVSVPPWAFGVASRIARPLNPRVGALLAFAREVSLVDAVAPARGRRRLGDYLREQALRD